LQAVSVNATTSVTEKVFHFLASLDGLSSGIVVAVSGGPDSMTLLHVLLCLSSRLELGPLVVAHLNHQLRGAESDADEAFLREWCAARARAGGPTLRLHSERVDVAALARSRRANLEATARRVRYEWLASVAEREKIRRVATGHTANDQAETVLHRLLRGSGLRGLRGIPERRPLSGNVELVRPLLRVTRAEVIAYLEEQRQPFQEDSSNRNVRNTRNRIRHELLPYLAAQYNPSIVEALCRLARQANVAHTRYESQAAALLAEMEMAPAGEMLVFDRPRLASYPRSLIREMFRLAWRRQGWPERAMGFTEWDRLAAVALGELTAVDLPGGIRSRARERVVQLGPDS
jgi:tRNA(Ile)-lysidine synthase